MDIKTLESSILFLSVIGAATVLSLFLYLLFTIFNYIYKIIWIKIYKKEEENQSLKYDISNLKREIKSLKSLNTVIHGYKKEK